MASQKNGLSDVELEGMARSLGFQFKHVFLGTFSKDELPRLHDGQCCLVNIQNDMDNSGKELPGTHWTALGVSHLRPWYFDSFGLPPPLEVTEMYPRVDHSATRIQEDNSQQCGPFSLGACYTVTTHNNRSPKDAIELYIKSFNTRNYEKNDEKIKSLFHEWSTHSSQFGVKYN